MDLREEALKVHENRGKIEVRSKVRVDTKKDLGLIYTPGVAEVCREIAKDRGLAYTYTIKGNAVAIVSDGSAVLGLKNIGAEAAMPVMEGKAVLFKELAGIDAFPLCLRTQDADEIVTIVKNLGPTFGGINLEDISAPRCFDIEKRLMDVGIPVMHDDQHGTAIVILAALINAAKAVGKPITNLRVVVNGAGAAGYAVTKLLLCLGIDKKICTSVKEILVCDSRGAIYEGRPDLNPYKRELASYTNGAKKKGTLGEVLEGADVFIGVSTAHVLTRGMIQKMAKDPIVFAMANPTPEIMPEQAIGVAKVFGTGRSDFPNQINNSLAFPGVFRGALDARARKINSEMKIAAANAIASYVPHPTIDNILPHTLDKAVHKAVAAAVKKAAIESGVGHT
ncbi:TPA: NADP-dependent malic enzyme [Candidatus Woesearchaeota archaeon]|nr:NADP-dependent malic enzyme [Candidatus Woesearchaeota archaeon]HII64420.1 NADP-dependent malic enzyme [Candidatus Woesearchaeota archaeon]HII66241.1 NADP-dependent malic enzyme [Candidatus Woesearchaeota archaeon]HIJ18851.1 NADP-dependent malic enzyme [Candidatus Woesearchaeota archaeon]